MPLSFFGAFLRWPPGRTAAGDILRSVNPQRLIVAITGATGAVYGVRLLEMLREAAVETHLVISPWGRRTLLHGNSWGAGAAKSERRTMRWAPRDSRLNSCGRAAAEWRRR